MYESWQTIRVNQSLAEKRGLGFLVDWPQISSCVCSTVTMEVYQ